MFYDSIVVIEQKSKHRAKAKANVLKGAAESSRCGEEAADTNSAPSDGLAETKEPTKSSRMMSKKPPTKKYVTACYSPCRSRMSSTVRSN